MNLPNKLTMARILLIPVFMALVQMQFPYHYFLAAAVFAIASFTDYLDGHIARKHGLVTDFGKFADPLADKILTTTAIIYLVAMELCSPIVLSIIMAREFAVSGVRMLAAGAPGGTVIAANMWGKLKTVLQMVSLLVVFPMLGFVEIGTLSAATCYTVSHALMWAVAAATAISGVQYLWGNRQFFNTAK